MSEKLADGTVVACHLVLLVAVDVGGNFGWFSTLGASLGCRVTSFEPVPIFQAFFEYSACRNNLRHLITLHPAVVSNDTSRNYTLTVPTEGQVRSP
jgi:hypothetical protein